MDFDIKKFQMSLWTFVKTGFPPFIVFIATVLLFIPIMKVDKQVGVWFVAIFMICLNGIPPFILHLNYYNNDKRKYIEINKFNETITIHVNSQNRKIKINDIEKIEKFHSNWMFRMSIRSYYYYKIILKDKTSFCISRMVIEKLENKIDNLEFEFISVLYPFIKKIN